ncbi:MAG: lipid-A-disaccharide synthase [Candidatus Binatia bacterium]|nr:lipid-A-disaccharide synthase [Candidatus Binatia bacterium]
MKRTVMIVAGEASGDLHGAALLRALREHDPNLQAYGIGGQHLVREGLQILVPTDEVATMGLTETLGSLRRVLRAYRLARQSLRERRPDLVVLIDYPDFNLRLARRAKKLGLKVFYYISPQVWAWRRGRVRLMRRVVDRLAVVFPFEEALYNDGGGRLAVFVGHPLLDLVVPTRAASDTRELYGLDRNRPLLALLPGSRRKEVGALLGPMLATARALAERGWQSALALAPTLRQADLEEFVAAGAMAGMPVVHGDTYNLVHACDAALVASGTATLEVALLGKPMVIVYRVSPLTYLLGRMLIRVDHIGMPNLILGRRVAPEFLQQDVRPEVLIPAVERAWEERSAFARSWQELRERLGAHGAARRAAALAWELVA